ncbi:MAG: hypothetical protein ACXVB1_17335, partial [Pseudobdellovibrionaceae bacterium]
SFFGFLDHWWSFVGLMPIIGREIESVKYFKNFSEARNSKGWIKVPGHARDLTGWSQGDSMTYTSRGGLLFAATAGYSLVYAGTAAVAQGTWETYVEKIESNKVYLKLTKGKLISLSVIAGTVLADVSVTGFRNTDDGFSFLYNLDTEVGRKAYEDAIRGNIMASQKIAEVTPKDYVEKTPVVRVSTFRNLNTGRLINAQLGIPVLWNTAYSRGKVSSFSASEFHVKEKTVRTHYGIFSEENTYHLLNRQRETDVMFYGSHYSIEEAGKTDVGLFGRYSYAYKNTHSNGEKLNKAIHDLIKRTAIEELQVDLPQSNLAFTAIDFETTLSKEQTLHLIDIAHREGPEGMYKVADRYLQDYSMTKDSYGYCTGNSIPFVRSQCWRDLHSETLHAIKTMYRALLEMEVEKNRDAKAFTRAYGEFGEAMAKNFATFRTVLELAGPGVEISYLLEGTRLSMYYKSWVTTETPNKWAVEDNPNELNKQTPFPFEPRLHRSKIRGIIVNPNQGGLVFLEAPLRFGIEGLPLILDTSLSDSLEPHMQPSSF